MSATAEKTGFEGMSRGVARKAGAPLRGPRCGQQRRCTGAECGGSAAVRRAIVFLIHFWGVSGGGSFEAEMSIEIVVPNIFGANM